MQSHIIDGAVKFLFKCVNEISENFLFYIQSICHNTINMVSSHIRHRFYDSDGNQRVLNATSDDQGKITDIYLVEYADLDAFAMGHTTSEGNLRTNSNGWNECEILFNGQWFPLNMQNVWWLPLDIRKP